MVKKLTLLELHLDDARFSNAVGKPPEAAEAMLDEMERDDETTTDDETTMSDETTSGRPFARALGMAAFATVVAVGVRTIARRFRADDEPMAAVETTMDDDEDAVAVDLDDSIDA